MVPKVKQKKAAKTRLGDPLPFLHSWEAFSNMTALDGTLVINLDIATVPESNLKQHWTVASRRHKQQKLLVYLAMSRETHKLKPPYEITLIRHSPRFLDEQDNLPMAFKWIVDQVSDCLFPGQAAGRADSNPQITWTYEQVKSKTKFTQIKIKGAIITKYTCLNLL